MIVMAKALLQLDLYSFNTHRVIYFTVGSLVIAVMLIDFLRKSTGNKLAQSISFLNELQVEEVQL